MRNEIGPTCTEAGVFYFEHMNDRKMTPIRSDAYDMRYAVRSCSAPSRVGPSLVLRSLPGSNRDRDVKQEPDRSPAARREEKTLTDVSPWACRFTDLICNRNRCSAEAHTVVKTANRNCRCKQKSRRRCEGSANKRSKERRMQRQSDKFSPPLYLPALCLVRRWHGSDAACRAPLR